SSDILNKIKDIQEEVLFVIEQTHERLNGKGYPKGIKGEQLSEYAKIVAVVDVYEALTHSRPHRKAFSPHGAIKELLTMNSSSKLFDAALLKVLINRIGIYPVGSWVELNSGEIGKVASANDDSPLRPKVNIIFGPDRKRLAQIKIVDLVIRSNLFIKRTIDPKELNLQLE
ncbi:MAG: HD-GYP domain-containing protein, partial [Candidatus Omnitrophica bacterium]|nr:HD-GYP domain-containing protein [Candidatus Omnitrophota bacterium]